MRTNFRPLIAMFAIVLLVALGISLAKGEPSSSDKDFVKDAASGGLMEVELGQLALERAGSQDVKSFADRLVRDHTKANEELMQVAKSENMTVPQQMAEKHQEMIRKLSRLNGKDFDRAYIEHMVKDHKEDIAKFSDQAKKDGNPELRSFASNTLPKLEEHLTIAKSIQERMG